MECGCGVWTRVYPRPVTGSALESAALHGDSPVPEAGKDNGGYPEYDSSDLEPECGTHLVLTLNTPKDR